MNSVLYVGMDVDKEKIAIAVLRGTDVDVAEESVIRNEPLAVRKCFAKLKKSGEVFACYEAGCFGFSLYRQLMEMNVGCMVAAPGLIPHRPSDRIKTDRRDARTLVRALRNGDLSGVHVPTKKDESVRDYLRMYEDAKSDLKKVKQRTLHFLLRRRLRYREGGHWTEKHKAWMRSLEMEQPIDQETLSEYLSQIADLEERCRRIARRIEEISAEKEYGNRVASLKAFKGIETLIALSLVVEIGDFRRFAAADQFMAFLGLVPSERSSGDKRRLGGITKAGNSHLRKLLIEAAWHYRSYHATSSRLMKRRIGLEAPLVSYANRAGRRLNRKYYHLVLKGKRTQVAATAVARELSGFIWGAMVGKVA
jgi:transposase